ncbi:sigma factor for late transcription [Pseudomonas phage Cassandra]|nr:sigma factor for late transcription [Pseudomonas phage Cassandra]WPK39640.1 sigma factor for late transcription [Pseudomonas phage Deifobo]
MNTKIVVNYINNKEMLKEIHRSKNSFCEYISPKYKDYDIIFTSKEDCLKQENINAAILKRAERLTQVQIDEYALRTNTSSKKAKASITQVDPATINKHDVVFRVITYEHIPEDHDRKKTKKSIKDYHVKLNFTPFKHFIIDENNNLVEVGRSHSKKGEFCLTGGSISDRLAKMFMLLIDKFGQKSNWRGYSYLDEMKGQALLQLASMGLQFDEHLSDNPFAYYTSSINNSFTRVFNIEKRNQIIRDDLLQNMGQNPSLTRQLEHDEQIRLLRELNDSKDD